MKRKLASLALEEDMVKKSLWVLAVVLIGAAIACTLDNPDPPDLTGPSTMARSVEVRAVPDQLISDGFSNSVIEVVLRGPNSERIPGAEIYFDIEGFVDLGNIAPINGARPSLPGVESTATNFTFFDGSTSDSGDPAETITFSWSFGDGSNGSGVTTSHVYAAALGGSGLSAAVNLTVTNSCGATASTSQSFDFTATCP